MQGKVPPVIWVFRKYQDGFSMTCTFSLKTLVRFLISSNDSGM
jgi:hypothetical protein